MNNVTKILKTKTSLLCILKITNDDLFSGLSSPLVIAEAESSSEMEADRMIIGTNIASNNMNGLVNIFLNEKVIPLSFIAS